MASPLETLRSRGRFRRWFGVHLAVATAVFVVGLGFGVAVGETLPLPLDRFVARTESALPDRLTFWTVFSNNLLAVAMMLAGGLTLGLLTLLSLFVNGLVVGLVGTLALQSMSPLVLLALVAPHGILEIPAFLAVGAIGLRVPHRASRYLLGYDETPLSRVELYELGVLVVLSVAAIAVAAFVEANYTRQVAALVR